MADSPRPPGITEDDILQLAVRRGYITQEMIDGLQTVLVPGIPAPGLSSGALGPRIAHLLQSGALDEGQVGGMMAELGIAADDQATLLQASRGSALGSPAAGSSRAPGPGSRVGHYHIERLLGSGGMGTVFLARDETLQRPVALKFLHGDTPDQERKFMREARAQAGIDHAHVCKVYEVGEESGRPFIAMQYIEGRTLQAAARDFTIEEKVSLMARAAEAIHAAHDRGLIHRDLKPANIMVRDGEDGPVPFVLDFGLSKAVEAPDRSHSGVIGGTPAYMAPEQASGRESDLDRRTDVYGLGATLYDIVADGPPFQGDSTVDILLKVIQQEPPPLGKRRPGVPADLETIVMKCLEKDRSRRYASARALAEDLRRYLNGEPILARRTSWASRAWKLVRRHPAVAAALAALVATLAFAGAHAVWSARAAQARRAYDQAFDREVAFVEETLRFAFTTPLHDTRPEREKVGRRLKDLESRLPDKGRAAQPSGHYALGRGYLELGDWHRALDHLRTAWDLGNHRPEAAYAFGRALGEAYFEELTQLEGIRDRDLREDRRKELEVEYRIPAIAHLHQSQGMDIASPAFVEGLILHYEKQYAQALAKADEAIAAVPWLYQAKALKGRVLRAMAEKVLADGRAEEGNRMFGAAVDAAQAAAAAAPSDPGVLLDLCRLRTAPSAVQRLSENDGTGLPMEEARQACEAASAADPGSPLPPVQLAMAWRFRASAEVARGKDPSSSLEQAEASACRALQIEPGHLMGKLELSNILQVREERALMTGGDRAALLDTSIALLEQVLSARPGFPAALNELGSACLRKARVLRDKGEDPAALLNKAALAFRQRMEAGPENGRALYNLGLTYEEVAKARIERKLDPSEALEEALQAYERLAALDPAGTPARLSIGTVHRLQAEYAISRGRDPLALLEKSIASLERAAALGPSKPYIFNSLGNTQLYLANYRASIGQDPAPDYRRAVESYRRELKNNPTFHFALNNIGEACVHWARHTVTGGGDPMKLLGEAREALHESLKLNPQRAAPYFVLGSADGVEAECRFKGGKDPSPAVDAALKRFNQGLAINPAALQAYLDAAKVQTLAIEYEAKSGRIPGRRLEEALRLLDAALAGNGQFAEAYLWRAKAQLTAMREGKPILEREAIEADLNKAESLDAALAGEVGRLRNELDRPR